MKIYAQKLVRVIAPFVSIFVVLFLCVLPVSAAGIDYNDHISNVVVDGDNDLVTVTIPASMCYVELYDFNNSTTAYSGTGSVHDIDLAVNISYLFRMHIFGYPWADSGCLDISNIPADTIIRCAFSSSIPYDGTGTPGILYTIYRNSSFVNVYHATSDYTFTGGVKYFDFALRKPESAVFLEIENSINFAVFDPGTYNFIVHDTVLEMSISSLYRLQQQTGKTNAILKEVESLLFDQGKTLDEVLEAQKDTNNKLDDIINGSSDQQNAADQFKDDVNGSVEDLDQFGNVMNNIPYPTIDTDSLVPEDIFYGSSYLTYISTIQEFWKSNTLSTVTLVLGSLLLISYVLFGEKG